MLPRCRPGDLYSNDVKRAGETRNAVGVLNVVMCSGGGA